MPATALSIVHKILKQDMFDLCRLVFSASREEGPEIAQKLAELTSFLEQHAAHENERFAPVMATSDPQVAEQMQREHQEQERDLEALRESAEALCLETADYDALLHDFGLSLSYFVGAMLLHLDREERAWSDALAPVMEGVEALGAVAALQPVDRQEGFLAKIWPVTTPQQRLRIEETYRTSCQESA